MSEATFDMLEAMVDVHCHILFGVDDGARSLEEGVAMARRAAADGCRAMIATPHIRHERWWNSDSAELGRRLDQLRAALGDEIDLHTGGEIACHGASFEEMLEGPEAGLVPSLAGSRYLLLELDWQGVADPAPEELTHEVAFVGWRPILAHPERVPWLMDDLGLLATLVRGGVALQITAGSLLGTLGPSAQQAAHLLLDRGWVHFVASDAHDLERRPPGLRAAAQTVEERWGRDTAQALFVDNPRAVLEDRPLPRDAQSSPLPTMAVAP